MEHAAFSFCEGKAEEEYYWQQQRESGIRYALWVVPRLIAWTGHQLAGDRSERSFDGLAAPYVESVKDRSNDRI